MAVRPSGVQHCIRGDCIVFTALCTILCMHYIINAILYTIIERLWDVLEHLHPPTEYKQRPYALSNLLVECGHYYD